MFSNRGEFYVGKGKEQFFLIKDNLLGQGERTCFPIKDNFTWGRGKNMKITYSADTCNVFSFLFSFRIL